MSLMDLNPGLAARSGRRRDYNFCGFTFAAVCLSELCLTCPHSLAATRPRPGAGPETRPPGNPPPRRRETQIKTRIKTQATFLEGLHEPLPPDDRPCAKQEVMPAGACSAAVVCWCFPFLLCPAPDGLPGLHAQRPHLSYHRPVVLYL